MRVSQPQHHEQRNQNGQHHPRKSHQVGRNLPILSGSSMALPHSGSRDLPNRKQNPPSRNDPGTRKERRMASYSFRLSQRQHITGVGMGRPERNNLEMVKKSTILLGRESRRLVDFRAKWTGLRVMHDGQSATVTGVCDDGHACDGDERRKFKPTGELIIRRDSATTDDYCLPSAVSILHNDLAQTRRAGD